jgi:hypothetical protein
VAEVRFDLTTYEDGRRVVRTAHVNLAPRALLVHLGVRVDGDLILALPLGISEEDEDDEELAGDRG